MTSLKKELAEAKQCYEQGDFVNAYERYLVLAKGGNGDSQVFLGWMIANGIGTQLNPESAAMWFERAALLGSILGAFYYARNFTVHGKHEEAFKWYQVASNRGDVPAIFRVGYSLARGKGTEIDIDSGYKYLRSAVKNGHIFALREIGILDLKGNRGFFRRIVGVGLLVYAVCFGIILSYVNRYSDRLRA